MQIEVSGISIELIRKNVKYINLTVLSPEGKVRASAPWNMPESEIYEFISSKSNWIKEKQAEMLSQPLPPEPHYVTGETLWFFGDPYRLQVIPNSEVTSLRLTQDKMALLNIAPKSTVAQRENIIKECGRSLLKKAVALYLPHWEQISGLYCSSWQIRDMKTRWGSCNTATRKLCLNLQLVQKPPECLEYVIMHELSHLQVGNHSEDFYAVLDKYMPDWQERRQLLNQQPVF